MERDSFVEKHRFWKKYGNYIIAAVTILVNIAALSIFFSFYYDLNDDFFMRDIMSGAYTGMPDGHNVQTLYVLGAFISLFYRLYRGMVFFYCSVRWAVCMPWVCGCCGFAIVCLQKWDV